MSLTKSPKVSIIIPVYNAQDYLKRCVDSVLNQEYTDFELLLLDDGSTDESGAICDAYAAQDERVRVVHKENGGVSAARNQAIRLARGTYLQFLDSDDWITSDATRLLVRTAEEEQCDLVIADFYRVVGERVSHKGDIEEDGCLTREEFAAHMMENPADFYYGVLWNKLYRRELVEAHGLRMNEEISWCEDFMFNLEYIRYAESFCALRAPIYYYVKRKGSLVSQGNSLTKTVKMKLTVFEYYHSFYKQLLDEEAYEKKRLQVYRFLVDAAGDGTVGIPLLTGAKRLGDERQGVISEGLTGEGVLFDLYRERKLMERYLEVAAIQNDLTVPETVLLYGLYHAEELRSKKELADFTGISGRRLNMLLQRLSTRGLIKQEEKKSRGREYRVAFLPAAEPVLEELAAVQQDCDRARLRGLTEEERLLYIRLSEKVQANMQRVLKGQEGLNV